MRGFLPKLGSLFASLVINAHTLGGMASLTGFPGPRAPKRPRLAVVARRTKVMRPKRYARDGKRILPAVIVDLTVCTHLPRGKAWSRVATPVTRSWGMA
ncbi:hypothetical protein EYW49_08965 [Siculibacillus lacustris]|uniref:Uncharacterized protein n=1 Tax=Siculibacillus lacustris TaxID=1549641 RepID=A0A4Q9VTB6_9HYPH|nr:hypothetical protein [Siculibacillus lacustris]TBW38809.1 hypothetical protein EYW49_08965 [Siculibacillus lacustris]